MSSYREDLAHVHDVGFGQVAVAGAKALVAELERSGFDEGLVVDLGCGSGITARILVDAGFSVLGFDLSPAMVALARERVPEGQFRVGSFVAAELPPCVGVSAFGEVLGYTFDGENTAMTRQGLWARICEALEPGGCLLFDMAGPERAPSRSPERTYTEGEGWVVLVERDADPGRTQLTRKIMTFRGDGEGYRRDDEIHRLELVEPEAVTTALESLGFDVSQLSGYGTESLPAGDTVFMARKRRTSPPGKSP